MCFCSLERETDPDVYINIQDMLQKCAGGLGSVATTMLNDPKPTD